jgi:hypothetical protein
MSIEGIGKYGFFEAADCLYSATAIDSVKEMQDFKGKSFSEKAGVVWDALRNKYPSFKWSVFCYKDGSGRYSTGGSYLWFKREEFWFEIVAMQDQGFIDRLKNDK